MTTTKKYWIVFKPEYFCKYFRRSLKEKQEVDKKSLSTLSKMWQLSAVSHP